jgi:ATP/maltotriose-dependent transcriptional regulator MalT
MVLVKTARPVLAAVLPRSRLFRRLDQGRRPITWVWGPPGSGKTTLLASYLRVKRLGGIWYRLDDADGDPATFFYHLARAAQEAMPRRPPLPLLTPEHRPALATFARGFVRDLYAQLRSPFAIVFDNYEEIPTDSVVHEVVREACEQLPDRGRVIVSSRAALPPPFARLRAQRSIDLVDWSDLRLTSRETGAMVGRLSARRLPPAALRRLYRLADGWAAGLVLLLEQFKSGQEAGADVPEMPEGLFDYFAGEILKRESAETREVLLRTAFLPRVTPGMAETLTGEARAGAILAELHRRHYFTSKWAGPEVAYEYHPLLRAFLRSEAARRLTHRGRTALLNASASALHAAGDPDAAAALWRESGDGEALARLVEVAGPSLVEQGRYQTVQTWLGDVPTSVIESRPWLLYCRGSAGMLSDFKSAHRDLERAFRLFQKQGDRTGALLAWSTLVLSIISATQDLTSLDGWIQALDELGEEFILSGDVAVSLKATIAMTMALMLRQPHHPRIREWIERVTELAEHGGEGNLGVVANMLLAMYHFFFGALSTGRSFAEASRAAALSSGVAPAVKVTSVIWPSRYAWFTGAWGLALDHVSTGLALRAETGLELHLVGTLAEAICAMLGRGDLESAVPLLQWMDHRVAGLSTQDKAHYHFLAGWHALLDGKLKPAVHHQERALSLSQQVGIPWSEALGRLLSVQVRHELRQRDEAREHLAWLLEFAAATESDLIKCPAWLALAQLQLDDGAEQEALGALRQALAVGRAQGYVTVYGWRPHVMARLCAKALEAGIEVEYVRQLVRARQLVPDTARAEATEWPWPVRIVTLGRFEMQRDGVALRFSKKAPRRPLDLLMALVALGGVEVPEDRLTEALWPDAEGDAAQRALSINIFRLRRLLGTERAIRRQSGCVGLDSPSLLGGHLGARESARAGGGRGQGGAS